MQHAALDLGAAWPRGGRTDDLVTASTWPERLSLLRDAGTAIATSVDAVEALDAWVALVVERFTDDAYVHAVDETDGIRAVAHGDRSGLDVDDPRWLAAVHDVLASRSARRTTLRPTGGRARRVDSAAPGHAAFIVPVVAQSTVLGAVTFVGSDERRWARRQERDTAEVLAATTSHPLGRIATATRPGRSRLQPVGRRAGAARDVTPGPGGDAPHPDPARAEVDRSAGSAVTVGLEVAERSRGPLTPQSGAAVWTDVVPLSGNRTALVAGQVAGLGASGSSDAAELSHHLQVSARALAAVDLPPDVVLRHLSALVRTMDSRAMVTCVYAVHDAARRAVQLANAGHAPPLLVRVDADRAAERSAEPAATASGPRSVVTGYEACVEAIGAPLGSGSRGTRTIELDLSEGAVLALAAGGIVEADRLAVLGERVASAATLHPGALVRFAAELVDEDPSPGGSGLVLARAADAGVDYREVELPDSWEAPAVARTLISELEGRWDLGASRQTVELLVTELVTNAVRHSRAPFALRLQLRGSRLVVEVSDGSLRPPVPQVVGWDDEQGRGLLITGELGERWGYRQLAAGKVVWVEIDLAAPRKGWVGQPRRVAT